MTDAKPKSRKIKGDVTIIPERCKGCGFCVEFCPTHVLAIAETFNTKGYHPPFAKNPDACTGCDLCGIFCPDFAVYGVRIKAENQKAEPQAEPSPPPAETGSNPNDKPARSAKKAKQQGVES